MHFVAASGQEQGVPKPDGASAEGLRAKLAKRNHRAESCDWHDRRRDSVDHVANRPAAARGDFVANRCGCELHGPVYLTDNTASNWTSTPLLVLEYLAALERALTLRNHWLIDLETGWFD